MVVKIGMVEMIDLAMECEERVAGRNQGEKETFSLGGMTITKGQDEEFAFEQVDLTLIQAKALHNWDVRIGPREKVVHVDRDLRVVYMKEICFKLWKDMTVRDNLDR